MKKFDWIVVGGGIAGISIAEILTRQGHSVAIVEKKKKLASAEKYYNNTFSLPTFTFENKSLVTHYLKVIKKICIAGY